MSLQALHELLRFALATAADGKPAEPAPRVLLVCAHPDDETLALGGQLDELGPVHLLYVTDGAPRDAEYGGSSDWQAYARLRREELDAALAVGDVRPASLSCVDIPDQRAAHELPLLVRSLETASLRVRPDLILTHPYEGGHPDHDACALAVAAACTRLQQRSELRPVRLEFTSYHDAGGAMCTGRFLADAGPEHVRALSDAQLDRKRRMLACFRSQRETLRWFDIDVERVRLAPDYDFTRPPHAGTLYYERFSWGLTADGWCRLARAALNELSTEVPC
jgi:LmbE family N-acetylglucosaminyl deacetylase